MLVKYYRSGSGFVDKNIAKIEIGDFTHLYYNSYSKEAILFSPNVVIKFHYFSEYDYGNLADKLWHEKKLDLIVEEKINFNLKQEPFKYTVHRNKKR